jgi:hypothetical protein
MSSVSPLGDVLAGIASRVSADMSERDVENAFLDEDFFSTLGYEGSGRDVRSEWSLPDNRRPDYVTLDANESVTAVYEFKTSDRNLSPHTDQLFGYVEELKADYGVLTNGEQLRLYRRNGDVSQLLDVQLSEVGDSETRDLQGALQKPTWDITDPESVQSYLDRLDPVSLDGDLGREHFFDTFRLEEDSPFADLVTASMDLLRELRDEEEAKFVKGAYDFWEASYASEPNETPDSWEPFIGGAQSLRDFMFCLESGHALLARLLLAKACEDHDFFPQNWGLQGYFDELQGFSDRIDLDAYPVAIDGLMNDMHEKLVESLFEDDIFVWWTEAYQEELSRNSTSYNLFREVAQEGSDISKVSRATRERFSRAVARVSFSVLKFDFSRIEGDPLGDLYQRYFDPETRKALGEFYTPQPVIDYILDGVEYERGVSGERLIDPSCGSGTFLVEAVNRYLDDVRRYNENPDWTEELVDLCSRPNIVGLDIHPFAVLMAQIRFMVAILPEYREAKRENPDFTIRRLPIFRTDTLRNERESTGIGLGESGQRQMTFDAMTEDNQDVLIPVPLPVEVDDEEDAEQEGDFLVQRVRMPLFDTIQLNTGVSNFGEYFAALQGVLDVVKAHMNNPDLGYEYFGGLERAIGRYTTREYDDIEEFFIPYVNDILGTVRYLKEEHGDGRLFKMFEDSVLALVAKNYLDYEYVVGNPPYVRKENISADYRNSVLEPLYSEVYSGNADLSVYFIRRGVGLLAEGGKLGYITSSRFTSTAYASGLREVLANNTNIREFSNFEMSNYFEDATAYPGILILENQEPTGDYEVDVVYGRKKPDESDVESVLEEIRRNIAVNEPRTTEFYSTYKTRFSDLDKREWRFTPYKSNEIFRKLQSKADYELSEVTKEISAGIKTGKNTVFILTSEKADKLDIDNSILKPIYRGSDIERYQMSQPEEYLIYTEGDEIENYPNAHRYLEQHKEVLESRKDATFQNNDRKWYELNIPHSSEIMESNKIICPEISKRNNYALDTDGRYILNKVLFSRISETLDGKPEYILGLLNSNTLEFFLKQTSSPLQNGYYQYLTRYQERLPIKMDKASEKQIVGRVERIRKTIDLQNQIETFPKRYMDKFTGKLDYIDYEWQTRRYPVNASIEEQDDGGFVVEAGRSDSIRDPRMESAERAQYVHAAVDGRNVKSGEEVSIPIPRRDEDVQELLAQLEGDRESVEETDIEALEAEIDDIVYDLFDLTDEERDVIEDYLEVF